MKTQAMAVWENRASHNREKVLCAASRRASNALSLSAPTVLRVTLSRLSASSSSISASETKFDTSYTRGSRLSVRRVTCRSAMLRATCSAPTSSVGHMKCNPWGTM